MFSKYKGIKFSVIMQFSLRIITSQRIIIGHRPRKRRCRFPFLIPAGYDRIILFRQLYARLLFYARNDIAAGSILAASHRLYSSDPPPSPLHGVDFPVKPDKSKYVKPLMNKTAYTDTCALYLLCRASVSSHGYFPRRRNYRRSNLSLREIHDCYYAGTAKGVGDPDMSEVTTAYFGTASWSAAAAAAVDRTIDRAAVVAHTATAPQQAADPLRAHR